MTNCNPFFVTPYRQVNSDDDMLRPDIPWACPYAATTKGEKPMSCRVRVHHRRKRKTGPAYPLFVMCCEVHDCTFTLYPPGFAPYQQQAVLHLSPCGHQIHGEDKAIQTDFGSTIFEAAVEPATAKGSRSGRRSISQAVARILGVTSDISDQLRQILSFALKVPGGPLYWLSRSSKGTLESVREVLELLSDARAPIRECRAYNLLVAGHLVGRWGEPLQYDIRRDDYSRSPCCSLILPERSTRDQSRFSVKHAHET